MGALPHRAPGGAAHGAGGEHPRAAVAAGHEAAGQDRRGALPERRRAGARPAPLPGELAAPRAHRRLPAGRAQRAGAPADPREALRPRTRGRHPGGCLRRHSRGRRAGAGAGVRLLRHRQVLGGQRAAQAAGAAARAVRLRQVRPVQAQHPVLHPGAGLPGPGAHAPGQERPRAGALAPGPAAGAGRQCAGDDRADPGAEADHRRAAAAAGAGTAAGAAPLPAGAQALHRRVRPAGTPAGAVPRRPAMAGRGHSRPAGRPADQRRPAPPDAARRLPQQRGGRGPPPARHAAQGRQGAGVHRRNPSGAAGPRPRRATDRRGPARRAGAHPPAGAAGARQDRRQPVLRHPVPPGPGRGGPAGLRGAGAAVALGPRAHPGDGLHRQRRRPDARQAGAPAGTDPGGAAAAGLPGQPRRGRDPGQRAGAIAQPVAAGPVGRHPPGTGGARGGCLRLCPRPHPRGGLPADPPGRARR